MLKRLSVLFYTRPLALSLFLFLSLLFFFLFFALDNLLLWTGLFLLAGTVSFLVILLRKGRDKRASLLPIALLTLSLVAACLTAHLTLTREDKLKEAYEGKTLPAVFSVREITYYENSFYAEGYFLELDGTPCRIPAKMTSFLPTEDGSDIAVGNTVTADFSFHATRGETLSEMQSLSDGYILLATAETVPSVSIPKDPTLSLRLATVLHRLRSSLKSFLTQKLPDNAEALLSALLLADREKIPFSVRQGFDTLGDSHLLAVSGLHLTVTVGAIAFILERVRLRRRFAYPILGAITLFYIILTGFSPSMLRAGGMLLLFYLSFFVRRTRDAVTSLLFAVTVIVCLSPAAVLDLGLLLSFAATLGILLIALPVGEGIRELSFFRERRPLARAIERVILAAVITLSANATVLPVLLMAEGSVFAFAVLSNLIFAPLFTLLLWAMPIFLLTAFIPYLSTVVIFLVDKLASLIFLLAQWGGDLGELQFSLSYVFMPFLILAMLIALVILLLKRKRLSLALPVVAFFLLASLGVGIANATLKQDEAVFFQFNGKNDAVTVSYEDMAMMIDFSGSAVFTKESFLATHPHNPSIQPQVLMLTSVTAHHVAVLQDLLPYGRLTHLILPKSSPMAKTLGDLAQNSGVTVSYYTKKEMVTFEGIAVIPHYNGDSTSPSALEITLTNKSLVYLKENAPNQLDIRLGILAEHHDVILYGGYGATPDHTPIDLVADVIVDGNGNQNLRHRPDVIYLDKPSCFTDERE